MHLLILSIPKFQCKTSLFGVDFDAWRRKFCIKKKGSWMGTHPQEVQGN
jgi:hypothetical protein